MQHYHFQQIFQKLPKERGGYYFVEISKSIVEEFPKKRKTRLKCKLNKQLEFSCGLNHLGDGNFFIIVSSKNAQLANIEVRENIQVELYEDPNPLGVDIPEVLTILLEQDDNAKAVFNTLTDGRKRTLIHSLLRVKNIDLQVQKALEFLETERLKKHR